MTIITQSTTTQSQQAIDLAFLPTGKNWQPDTNVNNRFIESGEHVVDYLATEIDKLDSPPIVIGHSMGGAVVQKYLDQLLPRMAPTKDSQGLYADE